ncbi:hypothetical protein L228DRAFT_269880 [Xylona heveae TC161]|uniref:Uncharacterized protein n=1 Tax=Xylona heveae (strain CBS 132557 / TC161) TaxID=1328760 RepID=A0A165AJE1_XYLHT|nr:hypothetical protein L228DRAFT_269880 [Xylona heveae TC161]KZF20577.1 hypothetical protein L228DRAFT_269880 [Xylona heveae TC161]
METPLIQSPSIPRPRHPQLGGGENDNESSAPAAPHNTPNSASTSTTSTPLQDIPPQNSNPTSTFLGSPISSPSRDTARNSSFSFDSAPSTPLLGPSGQSTNGISYRTSSGQPLPPTPPKDNRDDDSNSEGSDSDESTIIAVGTNTDGSGRSRRATVTETSPRAARSGTGISGSGIVRRNTVPRRSPNSNNISFRINRARLVGSGRLTVNPSPGSSISSRRQSPLQSPRLSLESRSQHRNQGPGTSTTGNNVTGAFGRSREENIMAGLHALGYRDDGPNGPRLNTSGNYVEEDNENASNVNINDYYRPQRTRRSCVQMLYRNRDPLGIIDQIIVGSVAAILAICLVYSYNYHIGGRVIAGRYSWPYWRLSDTIGFGCLLLFWEGFGRGLMTVLVIILMYMGI